MNKRLIKTLIFNMAETLLIVLIGKLLNLPINFIIIIILVFIISRGFLGKALHFKSAYRCCVWSALILLTLFLVVKIDFKISVLFTIFSAFIMTGKCNINDMYLWKPANESKYKDIEEYIKYNEFNTKLLDFEEALKRRDNLLYLIYKYRFRDKMTFSEMSEKLDMENPRIVEKLNQIALAIRITCSI